MDNRGSQICEAYDNLEHCQKDNYKDSGYQGLGWASDLSDKSRPGRPKTQILEAETRGEAGLEPFPLRVYVCVLQCLHAQECVVGT